MRPLVPPGHLLGNLGPLEVCSVAEASPWVRRAAAAKRLSIGHSQLNQLALDGKIARIPVGNGQYRYIVESLESYLATQQSRYIPDYLQKQMRDRPHRIDPLYLAVAKMQRGDYRPPLPIRYSYLTQSPPDTTDEHLSDASST
jgi:hypothetical protein